MKKAAVFVAAAVLFIWLAGCGGSGGGSSGVLGPPAGGSEGPSVQALGPLLVETAASADYKSVAFGTMADSLCAFTGIYGSKITRLEYRPAPGRLVGRVPGNDRAGIIVSAEDGSNDAVIIPATPGYPYPRMPRYSADGNLIALMEGGRFFVCNRDGSDLRVVLTREDLAGVGFDWVPNSNYFVAVFIRATGQWDLGYTTWSNGSAAVTWMTDTAAQEYEPDVSRDGRMITWSQRGEDGDGEIWYMPLWGDPTQDAVQITSNTLDDRWPRWSPDGQYIAWHGADRASSNIYVYDVYRGILRQLTNTADWDKYPAWTSDSRYVLFCRGDDLYKIPVDGSPGDEVLLAADWGTDLDSWAPAPGRYRVLIGPDGTDWDGNDPPFGTQRLGAIVVYTHERLVTAVTFSVSSGETIAMRDRSSEAWNNVVVAEVRAGHIHRVLMDNGAGVPKTVWDLRDEDNNSPGAVLVAFNADSGRVASVIPIWEQATSAAAGGGVRVERQGNEIVISGAPMRLYDAAGKLLSGPEPVYQVRLDGSTGQPLL